MSWRQISRKTLYDTPYMKLHEDTVELDNSVVIDDFSVVEFSDGVVVVATDVDGRLIAVDEYKYAANVTLRVLPGGGIEQGDTPQETALKELREETGYESDEVEIIGTTYEYPSKLSHTTYIARVRNARKTHTIHHEITEVISVVHLMDFTEKSMDSFEMSVNITALCMALKK